MWRVALRKESVDRNYICHTAAPIDGRVALRKESVDRNIKNILIILLGNGRSPQGERG